MPQFQASLRDALSLPHDPALKRRAIINGPSGTF